MEVLAVKSGKIPRVAINPKKQAIPKSQRELPRQAILIQKEIDEADDEITLLAITLDNGISYQDDLFERIVNLPERLGFLSPLLFVWNIVGRLNVVLLVAKRGDKIHFVIFSDGFAFFFFS